MTSLTLNNAGFSYGDTSIFKNITLEVHPGSTLCILGPNGSGKTTLMDALLGIHRLTHGSIYINGKDIRHLSPGQIARVLAFVPQNHAKHFSFSVRDVLLMGRSAYTHTFGSPGPKDLRIVDATLAQFNLSHLAHRDYTRLSGGETQLVMIIRALVQDTPIIVMDEPTAHLDFKHEITVLETIVRLIRNQGKTLIMATHFPNHAFFLENQGLDIEVGFLHREQLHMEGSPSDALTWENLRRYYGVDTCIMEYNTQKTGKIKQIFPISTTKEA
ncbi:MAG TPA: iron ABC transporter ATP-binding protein [Desulfobacteraceae bacterium]|nr:iron ABC transporter ATP-binding protein [Desulfobacteraceae bacterium]